jgi:6-phosphofructokinase 2
MSRILTITFSPCIDKSTSIQELLPDKKLKCSSPKIEPGGGGINVARAIGKLGGKAVALYPSGGCTGKILDQLLKNERVSIISIRMKQETRENIIVFENSTNKQFRLGMPGNALSKTECQELFKIITRINNLNFIVASGSLSPGIPPNFIARIADIAKRKHAKLIIDTSGEPLRSALAEGVYMIKPNASELSYLANKEYLQENEMADEAKKIITSGQCEIIIVSLGAKGALLVTKDKATRIVAPPVRTISTVGAGDSMVAGIIMGLSKGYDIETAAKYGVACGTAATMNPGTELCHKEDADKLFTQIRSLTGIPALV